MAKKELKPENPTAIKMQEMMDSHNKEDILLKAAEYLGLKKAELFGPHTIRHHEQGTSIFHTEADLAEMLRLRMVSKSQHKRAKVICKYEDITDEVAENDGYDGAFWIRFIATPIQKIEAALLALGGK